MSDRVFNLLIAGALLVVGGACILAVWLIVHSPTPPAAAPAGCETFSQTSQTVCGRFLAYWREHGGLTQQGYPLSGELQEVSPINGQTYTTQYFERAVFEYHPENQPPYDVLLALVGTIRYRTHYRVPPVELDALPAALQPGRGKQFPETRRTVDGLFLDYWAAHGGLPQFGYPIANPITERSETDGHTYLVQYFERALFELHPENQAPYNVLPALLGRFEYQRRYPGAATPRPATPLPAPSAAP